MYVITMVDEKGECNVSYESYLENGEWAITCRCRKLEKWGILCSHKICIRFFMKTIIICGDSNQVAISLEQYISSSIGLLKVEDMQ